MRLHILAVLFVIGTFTRVTFVAFALPIGWQLLRQISLSISIHPRRSSWRKQALTLLPPTLTATLTSLAIILTDTYYFRDDFSTLVITPFNFLSYNLSPRNLAEHGIHPRWLHIFVNLPMMVGPPLLWLAVPAGIQHWGAPAEKKTDTNQVVDRSESYWYYCIEQAIFNSRTAMVYAFLFPITVLSIQPHQEPRFLSAFLVLFVVFVANSGNLLRAGRIFWVSFAFTIRTVEANIYNFIDAGNLGHHQYTPRVSVWCASPRRSCSISFSPA